MNVSQLTNVIRSQMVKYITLVFAGNMFSAGLGLLAIFIISRKLSVSDFGLFSLSMSVIIIVSKLSGMGLDSGMIRFGSFYLGKEDMAQANQVLRETFIIRVISGFVFAITIFCLARLFILHDQGPYPLVKLIAFGIFAVSVLNYFKSALSTCKLFKSYVFQQIAVEKHSS